MGSPSASENCKICLTVPCKHVTQNMKTRQTFIGFFFTTQPKSKQILYFVVPEMSWHGSFLALQYKHFVRGWQQQENQNWKNLQSKKHNDKLESNISTWQSSFKKAKTCLLLWPCFCHLPLHIPPLFYHSILQCVSKSMGKKTLIN